MPHGWNPKRAPIDRGGGELVGKPARDASSSSPSAHPFGLTRISAVVMQLSCMLAAGASSSCSGQFGTYRAGRPEDAGRLPTRGVFMRDRPVRHRGLLRAFHHQPAARLSAILALFSYVLIGLSPLWVPAVERASIELCTANGITVVPVDLPYSGAPDDKQEPQRDCSLCTIHAASLLLPVESSIEPLGHITSAVTCADPSQNFAGLFAGFDHLSRAPPLLS